MRVDCTLGEDDLEREIFGEDAGLRPAKAGALERAQGGSMFLDQVGEMALGVQVKLARALEIKRFSRMNGTEARAFDVRVTSASHVATEPLITSGRLRRELYNRVNGIAIAIPALRERKSDLPLLAASFVRRACRQLGKREPVLGQDALATLDRHTWPGNLRELRQVVERAAVVCDGDAILPQHLTLHRFGSAPPQMPRAATATDGETPSPPPAAASDLRATERRLILDALEQSGGNQTRAAELLGMSRRTLVAPHRQDEPGRAVACRGRRDPGGEALARDLLTSKAMLVLGRYALYEEIARGGMATVHLGWSSATPGSRGSWPSSACIPAMANDPDFVAMFLDEARLASRVRHPNVVSTLDVGSPRAAKLFLVMEYVHGESLANAAARPRASGEQSPRRGRGQHRRAACSAACTRRTRPTDEPANRSASSIATSRRRTCIVGVDGVARVLDFGIAKAAARGQTRARAR